MNPDEHPDDARTDSMSPGSVGDAVFGDDPFALGTTVVPPEPTSPPPPRRLDLFSGIAGATVLVIAILFAVLDLDALDEQARLIGPIGLVGLGLALLATTLQPRR